MHFDPNINLGNLVTIALAVGGFIYGVGKAAAKLDTLGKSLDALAGTFEQHIQDDQRRFEAIQRDIASILGRLGGKQ